MESVDIKEWATEQQKVIKENIALKEKLRKVLEWLKTSDFTGLVDTNVLVELEEEILGGK